VSVTGIVRVACPACSRERDCTLVQSINTATDREAVQRLLAGDINVLACDCGARTQLAARLVFRDPERDYTCQVVPDGKMAEAAALFEVAGLTGTRRLVPSQNALVEKVRMLEAGLADWALEMTKVLLLASVGGTALEDVLLFEGADGGVIHWLRFAAHAEPSRTASALGAYEKLATRDASRPRRDELRIDRAWAIAAVEAMITSGN
jgi:hypothetical protein